MEWKHQHNRPTSSGEAQIPNGSADQPPISGGETLPPATPECRELPHAPTDGERRRGLGKFAMRSRESSTNTQSLSETSDVAHEPIDETEEIEEGPEMSSATTPVIATVLARRVPTRLSKEDIDWLEEERKQMVATLERYSREMPPGLRDRTSDATIVNDPPIVPYIR